MKKKYAVLIDRDGVINKDLGTYVRNFEEFKFLPHSVKALALLHARGFTVGVVSNQAGVGKGLMTKEALNEVTARMRRYLKKKGAALGGVFYCVHAPQENCPCRKPKTGLFKQAARALGINLKKCYYIGDDARDVRAGTKAGCRVIVVLTGKIKKPDLPGITPRRFIVKKNLYDAVRWIINQERGK